MITFGILVLLMIYAGLDERSAFAAVATSMNKAHAAIVSGFSATARTLVASATGDRWADPRGEFLALKHAGPVYQLFHEDPFGVEQT